MDKDWLTQEQYDRNFKADPELQAKALEHDFNIRELEIELYWKRAEYILTFIGLHWLHTRWFLGWMNLKINPFCL